MILTVKQAAKKMEISQSLLYRLVGQGKIQCYRVGNNGIRLNWERHVIPYLESVESKLKTKSGMASTANNHIFKHLDLS